MTIYMDMNPDKHLGLLKSIFSCINNLTYQCSAREYTLDEDNMMRIFMCRDLVELAIRECEGKEKI